LAKQTAIFGIDNIRFRKNILGSILKYFKYIIKIIKYNNLIIKIIIFNKI